METSLENMIGYGKKTIVAGFSLLYIGYISLTTPCCGRGGHNSNDTSTMPNNPPVAKALFSHSAPSNQHHPAFVHPRDGVVLDGSCSYDPDGNHTISYIWSMSKKPAGSSLTDNDILNKYKPNTVFFPDVEGDYTLELRVTDEKGASTLTYITVSVQKDAPAILRTIPPYKQRHKKKEKAKEEPKKDTKKEDHNIIKRLFKKK